MQRDFHHFSQKSGIVGVSRDRGGVPLPRWCCLCRKEKVWVVQGLSSALGSFTLLGVQRVISARGGASIRYTIHDSPSVLAVGVRAHMSLNRLGLV